MAEDFLASPAGVGPAWDKFMRLYTLLLKRAHQTTSRADTIALATELYKLVYGVDITSNPYWQAHYSNYKTPIRRRKPRVTDTETNTPR